MRHGGKERCAQGIRSSQDLDLHTLLAQTRLFDHRRGLVQEGPEESRPWVHASLFDVQMRLRGKPARVSLNLETEYSHTLLPYFKWKQME